MQRQVLLTRPSSSDGEPPPLDVALAKPADDEVFYTASVHFLRKRLQEKCVPPRVASQSCCNLAEGPEVTFLRRAVRKQTSLGQFCPDSSRDKSPELQMHQVLPFPKSNKDSFFTRVLNTFRKYRQRLEMHDAVCDEEIKNISNFKFPRCERLSKRPRRSCLVQISEEHLSNENIKDGSVKSSEIQ